MLKAHVGAHGVIAVVKGLGYGTDPVVLGRLLEAQGVDWLAVAYADEGVALRGGHPGAHLGAESGHVRHHAPLQLEPQLVSTTHIQMAQEWALAHGVIDWPVHLKLDTGMHRLGLAPGTTHVANLLEGPELTLASVMTLARADDPGLDGATLLQIQSFMGRVQAHFRGVPCHVLNSAGATRLHEMLTADQRRDLSPVLSHLRVGLAMYGLGVGSEALGLQPVLSLHVCGQTRARPSGEGTGYGLTDAADHDRTLAVLSVGYRRLPSRVGERSRASGLERHDVANGRPGVHGHGHRGRHGPASNPGPSPCGATCPDSTTSRNKPTPSPTNC